MAHSVEFLLDEACDQYIRQQWATLGDAGLPSAADNGSATNRPHITAMAAARISPDIDAALGTVAMRLPIRVTLGDVVVFGHGARRVLARLIVPSAELLSVHASIVRVGAALTADNHGQESLFAHTRPGSWTPHLTVARRIGLDKIGRALETLDSVHPADTATITGVRRWDGDAKVEHVISGRSC
ncbi:2'-5' RNA ligase family protein [Gordonia oryzae]|uniref:2'-5' RNA ligase family protein n=1 Tax=Gordonia oryzae TaxID=2487349 RepID=A0A3N4GPZ6_9ACTN|nr:2'-5' RNA ligase family protein [Gordonia oryzae]RPA63547.1 2'-5' RNA ligase family protein [Gordonia oryzae]